MLVIATGQLEGAVEVAGFINDADGKGAEGSERTVGIGTRPALTSYADEQGVGDLFEQETG